MTPHRPRLRRLHVLVTTLVVALPLSCSRTEQEGEVTDAQGCRTIILPEPAVATSSSTTEDVEGTTTGSVTTATTLPATTGDSTSSSTTGTPECGNGIVEDGEACDDGGVDSSSCNADCSASRCGDGYMNAAAGEACDDGGDTSQCNSNPKDPAADCHPPKCGDGYLNAAAGEVCDDGMDTAQCNSDPNNETPNCKPPSCGDAYTNPSTTPPEQCDDGAMNSDTGACTSKCEDAFCGDGLIEAGAETCDLGANNGPGSGCVACALEVRKAFVSSVLWKGDLGGLGGADAKCQGLAQGAGLSGTFMAWLSDGKSGPSTRFGVDPAFIGLYELIDGTAVANGWSGLTSGMLEHSINLNEKGTMASSAVWTNTRVNGTPASPNHCVEWSNSSSNFQGSEGAADQSDQDWTNVGNFLQCTNLVSLYCIQVQ